ncbi:MAG TPA: hypothetical protein VN282_09660 [Pyrinomonadaceae bacterium]|nr:hypothetical protein [Pyrinomonadaceae bacterium]
MSGGLALGWLVGLSVSPVIQTILTSLVAVVVSITSALAGLHAGGQADGEEGPAAAGESEPRGAKSHKSLPVAFDPVPVALMVIGLACGASVGVYARTNDWLGARGKSFAEEWSETGLPPQEITRRVFDTLYPPSPAPGRGAEVTAEEPKQPPPPQQQAAAGGGQQSQGDSKIKKQGGGGAPAGPPPAPRGAAFSAAVTQDPSKRGVLFTVTQEECLRLRNADTEDELRREMASSSSNELTSLAQTCKSFDCLKAGVRRSCANSK